MCSRTTEKKNVGSAEGYMVHRGDNRGEKDDDAAALEKHMVFFVEGTGCPLPRAPPDTTYAIDTTTYAINFLRVTLCTPRFVCVHIDFFCNQWSFSGAHTPCQSDQSEERIHVIRWQYAPSMNENSLGDSKRCSQLRGHSAWVSITISIALPLCLL